MMDAFSLQQISLSGKTGNPAENGSATCGVRVAAESPVAIPRSVIGELLRKAVERPQVWMRLWALNPNEWIKSNRLDDWRVDAVTEFKRLDSDVPLCRTNAKAFVALCDAVDTQAARIAELEALLG